MYKNELQAIKRANRYRDRIIYDENIVDFASNDYLGLAEDKDLFKKACTNVLKYSSHSPKASQLVNGYHPIHEQFEAYLCKLNNFEAGIVAGSGFLANLSLIEALPRRKDILIMDEEYHASGVLASKLLQCEVKFFKHNDANHLEEILKNNSYQRAIVAVEGIYSMEGDILDKNIFDIADKYKAILIVDEAHSNGVLGKNLLGVFAYYQITPKENHIKMGTLGKAIGSYGAYILASQEIIDFLQNRAKPIIYATAPSIFDIALSLEAMKKIEKEKVKLAKKIENRVKLIDKILNIKIDGLILKVEVESSAQALELKDKFLEQGFLIGAIRPPTVKKPILRIIPRVNVKKSVLKIFLSVLKKELDS